MSFTYETSQYVACVANTAACGSRREAAHARPSRGAQVTELLDYAFANMLLISSTVYGICRVADLRDGRAQTAVAVVAAALFAVHVHTLWQPARFPYDYNMKGAQCGG